MTTVLAQEMAEHAELEGYGGDGVKATITLSDGTTRSASGWYSGEAKENLAQALDDEFVYEKEKA